MSGYDDKVLLDLNSSGFQLELFELDISEIKKVFKTLKKLTATRSATRPWRRPNRARFCAT